MYLKCSMTSSSNQGTFRFLFIYFIRRDLELGSHWKNCIAAGKNLRGEIQSMYSNYFNTHYQPHFHHHLHQSLERQNENDYGAKGALNTPTLTLPQMLTYAIQDEFLAQARYNNILLNFGYNRTFARIQEAELRHINALLPLFERYQVQIPEDISRMFVTTPETIKNAFAIGVQGEIENISMYNKFLSINLPADVRTVFTQLRNASLNHLDAFERGLSRKYVWK